MKKLNRRIRKCLMRVLVGHLLLQAFDLLPMTSLSGHQGALHVSDLCPVSLCLPLSLVTLPPQTFTETVRLLHLGQLSLLTQHTNTEQM